MDPPQRPTRVTINQSQKSSLDDASSRSSSSPIANAATSISFVNKLKHKVRDNAAAIKTAADAFALATKDPEAAAALPLKSVKYGNNGGGGDRGSVADASVVGDRLSVMEDGVPPTGGSPAALADVRETPVDEPACAPAAATVAVAPPRKRASLAGGFAIAIKEAHLPAAHVPRPRAASGYDRARGRTAAAHEGIVLLKKGCPAIKVSQRGRQRPTTFRLSDNEASLGWDGAGVAILGKPRQVLLADVLAVQVGQESQAFSRARLASGRADKQLLPPAMSLTLKLTADLPARPDDMDEEGRRSAAAKDSGSNRERGTLDVCLHDQATFDLWVAALEALTSDIKLRPAPYASPMNPMHASAASSVSKEAPPDATCYERLRDASLRLLSHYSQTRLFVVITVVWGLCVVVFGALYFFLLVGWHGMEANAATDLGNVSIQILTGLFSYILFLTLPWRVANMVHLLFSKRSCEAGMDLYGRPTNGICAREQNKPNTRRVFITLPLLVS